MGNTVTLEQLRALIEQLLDPTYQRRQRELAQQGEEFYFSWLAHVFGFESADEFKSYLANILRQGQSDDPIP